LDLRVRMFDAARGARVIMIMVMMLMIVFVAAE
jgi:hypothetical protein